MGSKRYEDLKKRIIATIGANQSGLEEILESVDQLRLEALVNPITGAPGFRALEQDLDTTLAYNRRINSNSSIYVLMIDIDRFGNFNKNLGEDVGNLVLKATADTIRDTLRKDDLILKIAEKSYPYHLHGEEFLVIYSCTRNNNHEAAISVAEKIRFNVQAGSRKYLPENTCQITVSLGLTQWHKETEEYSAAQKRADSYMQIAKTEGRNRVYCGDNEPLLYALKCRFYTPGLIDDLAKTIPDLVRGAKGYIGRLATSVVAKLK